MVAYTTNFMNPSDFIGYLIKSSGLAFAKTVNKRIKAHGLPITIEQVGIIFRLNFFPGITQNELAEFFFKDKTTIARTISTMEKNNLLLRVPSEKDKRVNLLYLTNKGKELQEVLQQIALDTSKVALKGIDKKELEITKKVLSEIRTNLEEK